jgi:preprotein translocase subunit SecG
MPTDSEVRERQAMRNRVTVILLVMFVAIVFALSFSHVLQEQPPAKKTTLVEEPAVEILAAV